MTIPNVVPEEVISSDAWNDIADNINQRNLVCVLSRTISVPNTGTLAIQFTGAQEESDPGGWHSSSADTNRITPTIEGFYLCNAVASATGAGSPTSALWNIRKNGSAESYEYLGINGGAIRGTTTTVVYMNGTTDYIDLLGSHNGDNAVDFSVRFTVTPIAIGAA